MSVRDRLVSSARRVGLAPPPARSPRTLPVTDSAAEHAAAGGALAPPVVRIPLGGLAARVEALATRRNALLALAVVALAALIVLLVRPTFPNYDSYYSLVWGQELSNGHLPDYDVLRPPTPHPLATLVGLALTPFGGAGDDILVLLSFGSFIALLALLFRFTQLLLGTLVGLVAVLVVLTRTDLEFFTMRAMLDVPFLALVFGAAVLELGRPRRGWPVIALLGLAGLLRPEAWLFTGAYMLWLAPGVPRELLVRYAAAAAVAPVLWLLADWIVAGDPLYSLTSTREVAGEFGRQRGLGSAIGLIPDYLGANERYVNVIAGGLGALLAGALLRRRGALPLVLGGLGLVTFLMISVAGLSVIPRYLLVPSLLANLCVAVALSGWAVATDPRLRRAGAVIALVTLALVVWRLPSYVRDVRKVGGQAHFVSRQHNELGAILSDPQVVPLLRSCRPITTPTHSAIPVIRYETGLPKQALQASIAQTRPPNRGLLLVGRTFNFEPSSARSAVGTSPSAQWWSNRQLFGFRRVAGNTRWRVYAKCG